MFARQSNSSAVNQNRTRSTAMMENLEGRRLFSITGVEQTAAGVVTITADNANDNIKVTSGTMLVSTTSGTLPNLTINRTLTQVQTLSISQNGQLFRLLTANAFSKVVVKANGGDDFVDCRGVNVPVDLRGGNGADVLYGGSKNDVLNGESGRDVLAGFAGDDSLQDMSGDDASVDGGDGFDTLTFLGATVDTYKQTHGVYNVEAFNVIISG
jgi:Ca2+-binding RTX toxin-like protein